MLAEEGMASPACDESAPAPGQLSVHREPAQARTHLAGYWEGQSKGRGRARASLCWGPVRLLTDPSLSRRARASPCAWPSSLPCACALPRLSEQEDSWLRGKWREMEEAATATTSHARCARVLGPSAELSRADSQARRRVAQKEIENCLQNLMGYPVSAG